MEGGPNDHIIAYLKRYAELPSTKFSILLSGPWGSGKTFFVKQSLADKAIFVSMAGEVSLDLIESRVLAAVEPVSGKVKSFWNNFQAASGNAGGGWAFAQLLPAGSRLTQEKLSKHDKIIVFDDLGRSSLSNKSILAIINHFVEGLAAKVVLVGDDEKFASDFSNLEEKVIGKWFQFTAPVDEALHRFIDNLPNDESSRIIPLAGDIKALFLELEIKSLRVLERAILELGLYVKSLEPIYVEDNRILYDEFVIAYFRLALMALADRTHFRDSSLKKVISDAESSSTKFKTPEHRKLDKLKAALAIVSEDIAINGLLHGNLDEAKVVSRFEEVLKERSNNPFPKGPNAKKKYKKVVLPGMGIDIRRILDEEEKATEAPWVTVINFDERSDEKVMNAIEEMRRQLVQKQIRDLGELTHHFCLMLLMSNLDLVWESKEQLTSRYINYMTNGLQSGKIPLSGSRKVVEGNAHGGYSFYVIADTRDYFIEYKSSLSSISESLVSAQLQTLSERVFALESLSFEAFEAFVKEASDSYAVSIGKIIISLEEKNVAKFILQMKREGAVSFADFIRNQTANFNEDKATRDWAERLGKEVQTLHYESQGFDRLALTRFYQIAFQQEIPS